MKDCWKQRNRQTCSSTLCQNHALKLNQELTVNVVSLEGTEKPPDMSSNKELTVDAGERGTGSVFLLAGSLTGFGVAPEGGGEITRLVSMGALWCSKRESLTS